MLKGKFLLRRFNYLMGQASVELENVPGEILLFAKAINDPYC